MDNFGIIHAFLSAGFVNKIVFIILLIASMYSWALIFKKISVLRMARRDLECFVRVIDDKDPKEINAYIFTNTNHYSELIKTVADNQVNINLGREELRRKCENIIERSVEDIEKDIDHLATMASAAPFIGLFGTVIGVINSFIQIGATSSASLAVIAPGIAEALYATALGLFVAVPASVFYNLLSHKIEVYISKQVSLLDKILSFVKRQ